MKVHILKTWPVFFWDVSTGAKTFEIRKNDRGFQVGDELILQEYDPISKQYSGEELRVSVTYTVHFDGVPDMPMGMIGMSIELVEKEAQDEQTTD